MILVPYHLDERLAGLEADLPASPATTVTADLPDGDVWARLAALYELVAARVAEEPFPVVVSGDCTVSLATVAGVQRRGIEPGIVWFDAHGDVQTLETTTSGYIGGMPLRILVGYRPELIADALGLRPIAEERAVLVDARDLDPAEADYLASAAIKQYDIRHIQPPGGPFIIHVDLDVVDPDELPGLLFPVPGGPDGAALVTAVSRLMATGRVVAVDFACTWRPDGGDERRKALIAELTKAAKAS